MAIKRPAYNKHMDWRPFQWQLSMIWHWHNIISETKLSVRFIDGLPSICRMYENIQDIWHGFTKIFVGVGGWIPLIGISFLPYYLFCLFMLMCLPLLSSTEIWMVTPCRREPFHENQICVRHEQPIWHRHSRLQFSYWVVLLWIQVLITFGTIVWKGRTYQDV